MGLSFIYFLLQPRYHDYTYFIDKETEAQRRRKGEM